LELLIEIVVAFEFAVAVTTAIEEENESRLPSFSSSVVVLPPKQTTKGSMDDQDR
jgi:hypothetical protein